MSLRRRRLGARRRNLARGDEHEPATSSPPADPPRLAALRLLGRRDYTAAELTARLIDRGYTQADVAQAVQRLVAERAIDDPRTARAYAESAARIKGRGRLRIRRELEARGIAKAIIEDVLATAIPEDAEASAIRKFLTKRRVTEDSPPADRRRVYQQLIRRGFSSRAISKALRFDEE